jgi:carboxyl-terminal processing protease
MMLSRTSGAAACLLAVWVLAGCSDIDDPAVDCSLDGRKAFVGDIMSDIYLWSDRVPEVDYDAIATPEELMLAMSFKELDHWSGMQQLVQRQDFFDRGRFQGVGYTLGLDADGRVRVSWVHEGSAAGRAGLDRGALLLSVNGRAIEELSSPELNIELGRDVVTHQVQELDGSVRDVELAQGEVEITSVKSATVLDTPGGAVGYLMFTTFVLPGEDELKRTFADFRDRGVERLVVDLRYNGGGLLRTAALLGSLIDKAAAGQPLIVETYNERHSEFNRERLMFETEEGISASHVVFLVTGRTASASEQVINGLLPYVKVDVVGSTTLGKPVGADSWEHCGYAIAPITFHSLNADGEGDYFRGIAPLCEVDDDLLHRLGDPEEAQLSAALKLLDGEVCTADKARAPAPSVESSAARPSFFGGPNPGFPGWY